MKRTDAVANIPRLTPEHDILAEDARLASNERSKWLPNAAAILVD